MATLSAPSPSFAPRVVALLLALSLAAAAAPSARAGGYLWLGAEFQGEGNIYRFNLATLAIDKVVSHAGADHWNNVTVAGTDLYLGHPTVETFNRHDAYSGDLEAPGAHSAPLGGHKEDGAYFEGSLWRATYSGGLLHRMTTAGVVETTFTSPSGLVGLTFAGPQGYASNYSTGRVGRLVRGATAWTFVPAVWAAGAAPLGSLGGLAYDAESATLYLATGDPRLYRVTVTNDTARAELVADLAAAGYPNGGLPDGLGWVPPLSGVDVSPETLPREGSIELGTPWPNPARAGVSFDVRLARPGPAHVGVYDLAGRKLRTWDLPGLGAGHSRFHWDLRTADGSRVPPGQYHARLDAGGESAVRPFTVLD